MKVESLTIENFRGIEKLNLKFSPNEPTVLIGINGSGKSSILTCFSFLFDRYMFFIDWEFNSNITRQFKILERIIRPFSAERRQEIRKLRDNSNINNKQKESNLDIKTSFNGKYYQWFLATKIDIFSEDRETIYADEEYSNIKKVYSDLIEMTENINTLRYKNKNIPLFIHYPVNRLVLDVSLDLPINPTEIDPLDAYEKSDNTATIDFNNFFEWFREVEDLENEERRDEIEYRDKQLEAVRNAIKSLIPGFTNLRVRRSPLRMTVNKNEEELTIDQLSDGEKCLLAMVGDLARRLAIANPGREDPLQGEGVVLIDEIELHLHPQWQREIIPALTRTFPHCQFIVTTHSPQVISHVKPQNIYVLESTPNGIIAKRPESSLGRDSNRILEDLMDTPARPQPIKDRLLELFRTIENGDLEYARKLKQEIAEEVGISEPELVKAGVAIRRKEILQR